MGVSKILKGINFQNLQISIDGELLTDNNISNWNQTLDMKEASFTTRFTYKDKASISYTMYALRNVQYSGYLDVSIEAHKDINVKATAAMNTPTEYHQPVSTFRVLKDLETTMPILQTVARSRQNKHLVAASGTFIWHNINSTRIHQRPKLDHNIVDAYNHQLSFSKDIKKGKSLDFAWSAAICTTQDFEDPQTESSAL